MAAKRGPTGQDRWKKPHDRANHAILLVRGSAEQLTLLMERPTPIIVKEDSCGDFAQPSSLSAEAKPAH